MLANVSFCPKVDNVNKTPQNKGKLFVQVQKAGIITKVLNTKTKLEFPFKTRA